MASSDTDKTSATSRVPSPCSVAAKAPAIVVGASAGVSGDGRCVSSGQAISPGKRISRQTTKAWEASTCLWKSHSSCSRGKPQMPLSAKLCTTGGRGGSSSGPHVSPPPRTLILSRTSPASARSSSHFTCTMPRPFAFLKEPPPLRSWAAIGTSIILKVPVVVGNLKDGDTATLSLPFNFLESTVHNTRRMRFPMSSVRTDAWLVPLGCKSMPSRPGGSENSIFDVGDVGSLTGDSPIGACVSCSSKLESASLCLSAPPPAPTPRGESLGGVSSSFVVAGGRMSGGMRGDFGGGGGGAGPPPPGGMLSGSSGGMPPGRTELPMAPGTGAPIRGDIAPTPSGELIGGTMGAPIAAMDAAWASPIWKDTGSGT
mmetsp:Transcript_27727/g.78463  ORF Transcript_27727/g.78463 Transcript_27727/m.78463 type:complete len:371 (+) Transcript_27727:562-1674(+)